MRPSSPPTIADLYLAFRQAKTALYFEKRGVGLLGLAEYERELPKNLKALESKLAKESWFDALELGETWIIPKRLRAINDADDGVVRIGAPRQYAGGRPVDIQLRLSPSPEFAIVEVLYLWRFGGLLDSLLSKKDVLGYRLDLRGQRVIPHRRWLFEYWPSRYQQFRTAPLIAARSALEREEEIIIVGGDLASFYDTVNPSFMIGEELLAELAAGGAEPTDIDQYEQATASLLRAYHRFHKTASSRAGIPIDNGVPIGALTSRIVANLALVPLDRHVASRSGVLCYRRYVDDLVIVAKADDAIHDRVGALRRFLPLLDGPDDVLRLDVDTLGRRGSDFQLQQTKVHVHYLAGVPGMDFLDAVASDFEKAVSERRAFIDSATLVGDGVTHLVRAGEAEGSPLRVLRDADRTRLERFALSTSLHSLERVSSLIDHSEARAMVRRSLERVGRVLDSEDNWVDDLDVSLRLLKLAISTGDWTSATELRKRMDRVWGTINALQSSTTKLYYRGVEIAPRRKSAWKCLRNYLHERRLEAVSSALPIGMDAKQIDSRIPKGLLVRTSRVGSTKLRRHAELLALADLRSRDREEDAIVSSRTVAVDRDWLRAELEVDDELSQRLTTIDRFVQRCVDLGAQSWLMPAARLFLCTRPPSYFDIARRWLVGVEKNGFADDVFERLLEIVNAVRGTDYRDSVGQVLDLHTVSIESFWSGGPPSGQSSPLDPRIILGNLVVSEDAWTAAAKRTTQPPFNLPKLALQRFKGLARVVEKAARVSRGRVSSVLVLPELSLPRRWFRTVSNHVVRLNRFGLVAGLEYLHDPKSPYVSNQVFAVFPGPFSSAATWPWTKRLPAREEGLRLRKLRPQVSFPPAPSSSVARTVVQSPWGALSVLICSELIETRRVADLLGRVDVVLCPAWNTDTSSYDHLVQSVGLQLHSIIAIANNGHYSDCRAWAPLAERWQRDLCRLIERDVNDIVYVDIPLASLVAFHAGIQQAKDRYARIRDALNRGDVRAAKAEVRKLTNELPGAWRPLPPDWP